MGRIRKEWWRADLAPARAQPAQLAIELQLLDLLPLQVGDQRVVARRRVAEARGHVADALIPRRPRHERQLHARRLLQPRELALPPARLPLQVAQPHLGVPKRGALPLARDVGALQLPLLRVVALALHGLHVLDRPAHLGLQRRDRAR